MKYCTILTMFLCTISFAWSQSSITGIIYEKSSKEVLVGVYVKETGSGKVVITDGGGRFEINARSGSILEVSYVGYKTQLVTVPSNMSPLSIYMEDDETMLGSVAVVGTRNLSRSFTSSPTPVDAIPMGDIVSKAPQVELGAALQASSPSFQSNRQTIADGTDHIDPAQIRGLSPDQTLVLVNGKRRHTSSLINVNGSVGRGSVGTDMNAISIAGIERVEVLRDGAAAQYGSDAIAGVVNIVLKQTTDRFFGTYTAGVNLFGDGQTHNLNANYGFKLGERGFINLTTDFQSRGYTNRADPFTGNIYSEDGVSYQGNKTDEQVMNERGLTREDFTMRVGNSDVTSGTFMINGEVEMGEDAAFYFFQTLNYRRGESAGFYRLPFQPRTITEIYPNGFLPLINSTLLDMSVGVGLKGEIQGFNVDLSNVFGRNSFDYHISNTNNASLLVESPTSFDAGGNFFAQNTMNLDVSRNFRDILQGFNVAFGTEFRVDNFGIVAGEEASYQNYGLRDIVEYTTLPDGRVYENVVGQHNLLNKPGGAQVFPGFKPSNEVDAFRHNISAYLDLELDVTEAWLIATAIRFEDYSDFGSTANYKLATRLKLTDKYFWRGSVSTGFRAPSLHQQYFNSISTQFNTAGVPSETGTFRNDSRIAQVLGIPKLKEETALNFSTGFTARPFKGFSITADYYYVKVDDKVLLTAPFSGSNEAGATAQQVDIYNRLNAVGANSAQFFTNATYTTTQGVDLVARYTMPKWTFMLAANFNNISVGDILTSDVLSGLEDIYLSRENKSLVEDGTPRDKQILDITYTPFPKLSILLRNVRYGEVQYLSDDNPDDPSSWSVNTFTGEKEIADQTFAAKIITDLTITYNFNDYIGLTVGANNLFDIYPDKHTHSKNYNEGRFVYSRRITQFGFNGAYYFGRLAFTF